MHPDLDLILQSARAVYWKATVEPLRFTYISSQAEELFGIRVQDWYDDVMNWARSIHPEDRDRSLSFCAAAAAKGEDHRFEYRVVRPDGAVVWVEDIIKMVQGPQGWEMVGVMVDISERRQAEELRQSQALEFSRLLQGVWDSAYEGVVLKRLDASILHANPAAGRLLGYNPAELKGKSLIDDLLHPHYREEAWAKLHQLQKTGAHAYLNTPLRRDYIRKDGSILKAEVVFAYIGQAEPKALAVFISDLAPREHHQQIFRAMVESSPDVIAVQDRNAIFEFISPNCFDQLGYRPDEVIGQHGFAILHTEDQADAQAAFARAWRGSIERLTLRMRHKAGRWISFDCQGHGFEDLDGRRRVLFQMRNVQQQMALFQTIVTHSVGLMVYFDLQEIPTYISPSAKSILGWDPEALKALPPQQWLHPEDYPAAARRREQVVTGQLVNPRNVMRFLCADGSYKRLYTSYVKLPGGGAIEGYLLYAEDVEYVLHAEELVRESEALHRSIVENSWDLLAVLGADGRIEQSSPSLEEALQLPAGSMVGRNLVGLAVPDDRIRLERALDQALQGQPLQQDQDIRLNLPAGPHLYEVRLQPLRAGAPGRVLFKARDVQLERESQEQLMQYQRLAVFGQLAAGFAHEVRNPLAGILGAAQLAIRHQQAGQDSAQLLQVVLRQSERLRTLMEDVLQHAKSPRMAASSVDPQSSLEKALESALQQFGPATKQVSIERHFQNADARLQVTEERLQRLLHNLILNALQALPPTGGRLRLGSSLQGAQLLLSVEDDGPGLSPEAAFKAFEPFFTTKASGSGLGLWIAQSLAREMGGQLHYQAVQPHGATFILTLPVA